MEPDQQEISLDEIFQIIKIHWKIILFPAFIASFLVWFIMGASPKVYESYSLLKIGCIGSAPFESISSLKDIMQSLPMRQEIAEKLNEKDNLKFISSINSSIEYSDQSGLLKIRNTNTSAVRAAEVVRGVTEIIIQRHRKMYSDAQQDLDNLLKYVKKTIDPIPLSSGVSEFRLTNTEIMVPPFINTEPMPVKIKQTVIIVFIVSMFCCTLISFILEGRKK